MHSSMGGMFSNHFIPCSFFIQLSITPSSIEILSIHEVFLGYDQVVMVWHDKSSASMIFSFSIILMLHWNDLHCFYLIQLSKLSMCQLQLLAEWWIWKKVYLRENSILMFMQIPEPFEVIVLCLLSHTWGAWFLVFVYWQWVLCSCMLKFMLSVNS